MNRIKVLDCTLRDGGYVNNWNFGYDNIKKIIISLLQANVDIIECGLLTNRVENNPEVSKFNTIESIADVIPKNKHEKTFVCMMNYGEYNSEDLPECNGSSVDGIRVAFHKKDMKRALEVCNRVKAKGYKLFIQPMVSMSYSDREFLYLIESINEIEPLAFYIVDSFGVMKKEDLLRLYYLVNHNLKKNIVLGFHSHNNLQLSYSNAQTLVDMKTKRELIIDCSVFGMGRGAGNLNTELFLEYLNDNNNGKFITKPLIQIMDTVLSNIYYTNYWGYSLPYYISAIHSCHPNYASYLDDKKTLTIENIDEILSLIDPSKRNNFDKVYIEEIYTNYQTSGKGDEERIIKFKKLIKDKTILIIAPGKSAEDEKDKIIELSQSENIVTISVNFEYKNIKNDYIFLSNVRRYNEIECAKQSKMIITSNIPAEKFYLKVDYSKLLNNIESVKDNAGMMVIKFLILMGVKDIKLAGMDGYSYDSSQNYVEHQMTIINKKAVVDAMNEGMCKVLNELSKDTNISFVTNPKYVRI